MANYKSIMPVMTGHIHSETGIIVSASSEYSNEYPAWKAFDDDTDNKWQGDNSMKKGWIKVYFSNMRYIVRKIAIYSVLNEPNNWSFEGSNNDVDWQELYSSTEKIPNNQWVNFEFENEKRYKYYRLNIKDAARYPYIGEIKLYEDLDFISNRILFLTRDGEKVYDDNGQIGVYPLSEDVFKEYGLEDIEELFNEAKQYIFFEKIGDLENGILYSAKVKDWERIDDIKIKVDSNYISFIPTMTSHKHTELEISPTDNYYPCWRAFDKRKDTYFRTRYQGDKEVIYLKFINKKYMIRRYTVYGKPGGRYSRLENIKVEVSNDNKNWMLLHEDKITSDYSIFDINNEELYSYYKITIYRPQSVGVDEIDFFFDELYKGKYYLITVNKCYYTIKDNKLIALSENIVSSDLFKDNGFRDIEDIKKVFFIENDFEILCYSDEVNICEDIA